MGEDSGKAAVLGQSQPAAASPFLPLSLQGFPVTDSAGARGRGGCWCSPARQPAGWRRTESRPAGVDGR